MTQNEWLFMFIGVFLFITTLIYAYKFYDAKENTEMMRRAAFSHMDDKERLRREIRDLRQDLHYQNNQNQGGLNVKHVIEVQLTPEIHHGAMAHHWQVVMINVDGKFTVAQGYKSTVIEAQREAYLEANRRGFIA